MVTYALFISLVGILFFLVFGIVCFVIHDTKLIKLSLKGLLFSIVASLILFLVFGMLCKKLKTETCQTAYYELVSLQDNSQVSGQGGYGLFYLHVSINTNDVYSFYYKVGNGYQKGNIISDNVTIYEQDNGTPCIIEYTTVEKPDMNPFLSGFLTFGTLSDTTVSYHIYVPTGTILQTYSLDAQ